VGNLPLTSDEERRIGHRVPASRNTEVAAFFLSFLLSGSCDVTL
jgi:hypothetical protein